VGQTKAGLGFSGRAKKMGSGCKRFKHHPSKRIILERACNDRAITIVGAAAILPALE
jgi:hypothetical protein